MPVNLKKKYRKQLHRMSRFMGESLQANGLEPNKHNMSLLAKNLGQVFTHTNVYSAYLVEKYHSNLSAIDWIYFHFLSTAAQLASHDPEGFREKLAILNGNVTGAKMAGQALAMAEAEKLSGMTETVLGMISGNSTAHSSSTVH